MAKEIKTAGESSNLSELIERRTTIQKWLAGLESQRGTASEHILERVRADYENRLRETIEALSAHVDGVRQNLDGALERARQAESAHLQAVEALEEGWVRNAIGEIADPDWADQRAELERTAEQAREKEQAAREESTHLGEILARLEDRPPEEEQPADAAPTEQTSPPDPDATLESWAEEEMNEVREGPVGSDEFLAKIDRSLSDEPGEVEGMVEVPEGDPPSLPGTEDPDAEEEEDDTSPKPGLKCGECGYTNDLSAWFCGVCGADVG